MYLIYWFNIDINIIKTITCKCILCIIIWVSRGKQCYLYIMKFETDEIGSLNYNYLFYIISLYVLLF